MKGINTLLAGLAVALFIGVQGEVRASESLYRPDEAASGSHSNWSVYLGPRSVYLGPKSAGIRYDQRMLNAARIAQARARSNSTRSCWRYVKTALVDAKVIDSYPKTAYAKQAGEELLREHGFKKLSVRDPFKAPIGSVLVYGGRGAGHVEIRTKAGFVSDFVSPTPSSRPLIGVYVKPS